MRGFCSFFGCLVLLVSGCSSGGSVSGPEVSSGPVVVADPVVETTVSGEDEGLASVLDGDPPSSTVSEDSDEQAAADVVHWHQNVRDSCLDDVSNCVVADFEETSSGSFLASFEDRYLEWKKLGIRATTESPTEQNILWARKSPSADGVIGVLECHRNYYLASKPDGTPDAEGSPTYLSLLRVVLGDDGRWRVDDSFTISEFQSSEVGGDTCLTFDGSEIGDEEFNNFMR